MPIKYNAACMQSLTGAEIETLQAANLLTTNNLISKEVPLESNTLNIFLQKFLGYSALIFYSSLHIIGGHTNTIYRWMG